jgi:hypothetical protein
MPSRERLDEFIAVVESGDHAGAIERYFTEDCRNGAATRYFASASSTIRPGRRRDGGADTSLAVEALRLLIC